MIVEVEERAGRTVVTVLGGRGEARLGAAHRVLTGLLPPPPPVVAVVPTGAVRPARDRRRGWVDSSHGDHMPVCRCGRREGPYTTVDRAREVRAAHRCPA